MPLPPRLRSLPLGILVLAIACGGSADGSDGFVDKRPADPEAPADRATGVVPGTEGSLWVLSRVDRSIAVIDPERVERVQRINLGFQTDPSDLVYWDGSVWVGDGRGSVQRVDAASRQLLATVPVEMDVWGLSAAAHGVYALDAELGLVTRHDPDTGEILATLDPPDRVHAMAAGPDELAVVTGDRLEIHFYPPGSTESRVVPAELGSGDMELGLGSFWLYDLGARLLRIDPSSGALQAEIEGIPTEEVLPGPGRGVTVGAGAVWITLTETGEVFRVDPATNRVSDRFAVGGAPEHLAVLGDHLWVTLPQEDAVIRIDPATGEETGRVEVEYPVRVIAVP